LSVDSFSLNYRFQHFDQLMVDILLLQEMFVVFHDEEKYRKMRAGSLEIPVEVIHQHIEEFVSSYLYYMWTSLIV